MTHPPAAPGCAGPLDAPIALVGRDWGFEEARAQQPFVGPAGKLLTRALTKAGLTREEVLITNVVSKRPAGNKWEAHTDADITRGLGELERTLGAVPRQVIVALGAEAFQAVRGHDPRERPESEFDGNGITELRGYVFDGPWGPVLASTHPAFILRTWLPWWPCLCWDLAKAKRWRGYSQGEEIIDPAACLTASWPGPIAIDIETAGEHAEQIKCIGFAWSGDVGFAQPFPSDGFARDNVVEILANEQPKVFHNGQFDVTILERNGLHVENWTDDTLILWHTLEPLIAGRSKEKNSQTQKSLRFLVSLFTDEPWYKSYDFKSDEEQLRLCAKDARLTWELHHKLTAMLTSTGANPATTSRPLQTTSA